jgi:hypothetical protein
MAYGHWQRQTGMPSYALVDAWKHNNTKHVGGIV